MKTSKLLVLALLAFPLIGCNNGGEVQTSSQTSTSEIPTSTSVPVVEKYFDITIEENPNGVITCDKEKVKQGELVTFYFTPNKNYELAEVTINDEVHVLETDHYTVVNVQQDLFVSASFTLGNIVVRYFVDDEVVQIRKVHPGDDASYIGQTPAPNLEGGKVFEFDGWSLTEGGEIVTSFIFDDSTDLYADYQEAHYTIQMAESLEIKTLHSGDLGLVTDYPDYILKEALEVEDESVCTLDKDYQVHAVKSGTTKINFRVGDTIIESCDVTISNDDNVKAVKCYPAETGYVSYNDNESIGTFNACQTVLTDLNGTRIDQKFIDFEGDFIFSGEILESHNFGIQINKELASSGSASKCFQFGGFMGDNENIFLKVNGTVREKATYKLEIGVVYHFRIVSTEISTGSQVQCYINGEKLIDSKRGNLGSTTNYIGFRYANSNNNAITFSNLHVQ